MFYECSIGVNTLKTSYVGYVLFFYLIFEIIKYKNSLSICRARSEKFVRSIFIALSQITFANMSLSVGNLIIWKSIFNMCSWSVLFIETSVLWIPIIWIFYVIIPPTRIRWRLLETAGCWQRRTGCCSDGGGMSSSEFNLVVIMIMMISIGSIYYRFFSNIIMEPLSFYRLLNLFFIQFQIIYVRRAMAKPSKSTKEIVVTF